jgi:hypothetical protein
MEFRLPGIDGPKAAAAVEKGFALKDAAKSPFNNPEDRARIEEFVRTETERFKGKGTIGPNPRVSVGLSVDKDVVEARQPEIVVSVFTNGDAKALLPNGDPDIRLFTHENLVWCYYPDPKTGRARGFETLSEHKKHAS